jgi:alginate O-acetyltransferase complex protein AlgI
LFTIPDFPGIDLAPPIVLLTVLFAIVEWLGREQQYAIADLGVKWYRPVRWAIYYGIIFCIFYFTGKEQQFIYFQF